MMSQWKKENSCIYTVFIDGEGNEYWSEAMFIGAVNPVDNAPGVQGRKRVQIVTHPTTVPHATGSTSTIATHTVGDSSYVAPNVNGLHWKSCLVDGQVACKQCKVPAVVAVSKENKQYWKCTGPGNCQWIGWVNGNQ